MIEVQALGSNLWPEHLYIRTNGPKLCTCDVLEMEPHHAVNLPIGERVCLNCGKVVTWQANDNYNRYWGYSGYDDKA